MNVPKRMPVYASQDQIRRAWLTFLCLVNVIYAILTIFGRSDGASQVLLRQVLPFATSLWGGVLLGSTALMYLGWSVVGGIGGATCWGVLMAATLVTVATGAALSSAGWVLPFAWTGLHFLVIHNVLSGWDADRERRQRR